MGRDGPGLGAAGGGRRGRHVRHAIPRLPAAHVRVGGGLPGAGGTLPDAGGAGLGHRARRPVQEAHPAGRHRRDPRRNRPLRRSRQHPPGRGPRGHHPQLPGAAGGWPERVQSCSGSQHGQPGRRPSARLLPRVWGPHPGAPVHRWRLSLPLPPGRVPGPRCGRCCRWRTPRRRHSGPR